MMKRVIVLALLQICLGYEKDLNLNREILRGLKNITNETNLFANNVSVPGDYMKHNPSKCVGTFSKELMNLVQNMTEQVKNGVPPKILTTLQKLQANLMKLGKNEDEVLQNCSMSSVKAGGKNLLWAKTYIVFLNKLNSKG